MNYKDINTGPGGKTRENRGESQQNSGAVSAMKLTLGGEKTETLGMEKVSGSNNKQDGNQASLIA